MSRRTIKTDLELKQEACGRELEGILSRYCSTRVFLSQRVVQDIEGIINRYCTAARLQGVLMPKLVVVWLHKVGGIEVVRADLEEDGLRQLVRNIAVKYPWVTAREVVDALRRAFPWVGSSLADTSISDLGNAVASVKKRLTSVQA